MKKGTKVIVAAVIAVLALYSVIATVGMREARAELEQKTTDYDVLFDNYLELNEKYLALVFDAALAD